MVISQSLKIPLHGSVECSAALTGGIGVRAGVFRKNRTVKQSRKIAHRVRRTPVAQIWARVIGTGTIAERRTPKEHIPVGGRKLRKQSLPIIARSITTPISLQEIVVHQIND